MILAYNIVGDSMNITTEELEDLLQGIKETVDNAYEVTKNKYGVNTANAAIMNFFYNYDLKHFTRDENARENMRELTYRYNEIFQILMDYAVSSYILNEMKCDIPYSKLYEYANDDEGVLDYSGKTAVKIVALASASNNYWTTNLITINKKLLSELITNFILERYVNNKKEELDRTKKAALVKFLDKDKYFLMSKVQLNNDIRNMNNDENLPEYIPPTRRNKFSQEKSK